MTGMLFKIEQYAGHATTNMRKTTIYLFVLFLLVLSGVTQDRGLPEKGYIPTEFVFISGVSQPPNDQYAGQIFLWIRRPNNPNNPHNIELPYSEQLASDIERLNEIKLLAGELLIVYHDGKLLEMDSHIEPNQNKIIKI